MRPAVTRKGLRLAIVSQWFPPEPAPIGFMVSQLAADLTRSGWDVTVITGFPNHPGGDVYAGYRKQLLSREILDGFRVWRVWLHTSARRSRLTRVLSFLSFTLTSSLALLGARRADVIFAVFQPISVGVTLPLVARLRRARLVLNVQDLHPDAPVELGLIRDPRVIRLLRAVERAGYRHADGLAVICDGFREHCVALGADRARVEVIPNWVDLDEIRPTSRETSFRAELGFSATDLVVLYAGTIGHVSGARVMLDVARRLSGHQRIKLLFVGEGPLVAPLKDEASREGLVNIAFAPFQPRSRVNEVQATADISVVTLLPGKGRLSVPSKVLGYLAAARPVIASVDEDSETGQLVHRSGSGLVTHAGDGEAMAQAILELERSPERRAALGASGRAYLERHLSRHEITAKYGALFERVIAQR